MYTIQLTIKHVWKICLNCSFHKTIYLHPSPAQPTTPGDSPDYLWPDGDDESPHQTDSCLCLQHNIVCSCSLAGTSNLRLISSYSFGDNRAGGWEWCDGLVLQCLLQKTKDTRCVESTLVVVIVVIVVIVIISAWHTIQVSRNVYQYNCWHSMQFYTRHDTNSIMQWTPWYNVYLTLKIWACIMSSYTDQQEGESTRCAKMTRAFSSVYHNQVQQDQTLLSTK